MGIRIPPPLPYPSLLQQAYGKLGQLWLGGSARITGDMMAHDDDTLAEDWVDLWQSELAAMAGDRELRELWIGLVALWADASTAVLNMVPGNQAYDRTTRAANRDANGIAGAVCPAGTTPAVATSDLGSDEARQLHERIAKLESRLSAFERRKHKPARPGKS